MLMYWGSLWKLVELKHTLSQSFIRIASFPKGRWEDRTTAATHVTKCPSLSNNKKENKEALNVKIQFGLRIFFSFSQNFQGSVEIIICALL